MKKKLQMQSVVLVLIMMQIKAESRTVNSKFKYNKIIVKTLENDENKPKTVKCSELSAPVLNDILGAAFNSR